MDLARFSALPDKAQLWVYGFRNPLSAAQKRIIKGRLEAFLTSWSSHGRPVNGAFDFYGDHFVLLAGWLSDGISGCSIDESVRQFRLMKDEEGLDGLDRSLIYYRDAASKIQAVPYLQFQKVLDSGSLTAESPVLDTTIQSLGELRDGAFERTFKGSWHARSFRMPEAASQV